jgi:predicted membrane protein
LTETPECSAQTVLAAALFCTSTEEKEHLMLYTIAVVLLILWLLGLVSSYTIGGFIHILLVLAIVVVLVKVITGRRAL